MKLKSKLGKTPTAYRDNMREKFFEILSKVEFGSERESREFLKETVEVSVKLECCLYRHHKIP